MKICIFMPTTFVIDKNSNLSKNNMLENTDNRIKQYKNGINKVLELNKKNNIDIYIADNGFDFKEKICIDDNIKVISNNPNNYGKINKGAGIIEIWNNNIEIIKQYDYIIHFEPRQLLIDNYFIDNFMKNPRTLFTYNHNISVNRHFNTGLFACKSKHLLEFINEHSPELLVKRSLGIENVLYHFFETNQLQYNTLDKMSLIWYNAFTKKEYYW